MTSTTWNGAGPDPSAVRGHFLLAVWSLFSREVVRFVRQPGRVVGALGTPLLFWLVLGSGFGASLRTGGAVVGGAAGDGHYLTYFFPGSLLLVVLFTTIFSSISIIQDRNEGFLQGVMAAPVPRLAIVLGKVLGGAALGLGQGVLMLLLAPAAGLPLGVGEFLGAGGVLALSALALSALGFLFAWRMEAVQSFHAVMNLLLFPMWLLSGAFFPPQGAALWIRIIMFVNPLTYGLEALRDVMEGAGSAAWPAILVLAGFTAVALALALAVAVRTETR